MSRRYSLHKIDGDGPKPCAFFSSEEGCRNGDQCKFLHGDQPTAGGKALQPGPNKANTPSTPVRTASTEVSSTSLSGKDSSSTTKDKKKKKKTRRGKSLGSSEAVAAPASTETAEASPHAKVAVQTVASPSSPGVEKQSQKGETKKRKKKKKTLQEEAQREAAEAIARAEIAASRAAKQAEAPPPAPVTETRADPSIPARDDSTTKTKPKPKREKKKKNPVQDKREKEAAEALARAEAKAAEAARELAEARARALIGSTSAAPPSDSIATDDEDSSASDEIGTSGSEQDDLLPARTLTSSLAAQRCSKTAPETAATAPPPAGSGATAQPESKEDQSTKKKRKKKPGEDAKAHAPVLGEQRGSGVDAAPAQAAASGAKEASSPAAPAPTRKVCAFFNKKGCRTGALCPFRHEGEEGPKKPAKAAPAAPAAPAGHEDPAPLPPANGFPAQVPAQAAEAPVTPSGTAAGGTPAVKPAATPPSAVALPPTVALPPAVASPPAVAPIPVATQAAAPVANGAEQQLTRKRKRSKSLAGEAGADRGGPDMKGLPCSPFVQKASSSQGPAAKVEAHAPGGTSVGAAATAVPTAGQPVGIPHPKADPWEVRRAGWCRLE